MSASKSSSWSIAADRTVWPPSWAEASCCGLSVSITACAVCRHQAASPGIPYPAPAASSRVRPRGRITDRVFSSSGAIAATGWGPQKAPSSSGGAGVTGHRLKLAAAQPGPPSAAVKSTISDGSTTWASRIHSSRTAPSCSTGRTGQRVPPQIAAAPVSAASS